MNKMPKIWLDYAKYLQKECGNVTQARKVYDRALKALPVTQHQLIWDQCLDWACSLDEYTATACHFYRRYIEFKPQDSEDYIDYLLKNDLLEEALELYVKILNDEGFVSKRGNKSRYQLWMELCEFIARSPTRSQHLTTASGGPDQLIRHALRKYTDEVGRLWICLADYYLR
jgi:pre-mRNA-splicing factor SYF1